MRYWKNCKLARKLANAYLFNDELLSDEDLRNRKRPEVKDLVEEYSPLVEYALQKYGKSAKVRLSNRYYSHIDGWIGVRGRCMRIQITQGFENRQTALTRLQMIQGGPVYPLAPKAKIDGKIVDVGPGISDWGSIIENWKSRIVEVITKKITGQIKADILLVNIVTDCTPTSRFNKTDFLLDLRSRLGSFPKNFKIELMLNYKYLGWV